MQILSLSPLVALFAWIIAVPAFAQYPGTTQNYQPIYGTTSNGGTIQGYTYNPGTGSPSYTHVQVNEPIQPTYIHGNGYAGTNVQRSSTYNIYGE